MKSSEPFDFTQATPKPPRRKKSSQWPIFGVFAGLAVVLVIVAAGVVWWRFHTEPAKAREVFQDLLPSEDRTPTAKMDAEKLIKTYKENSSAFRSSRDGKYIQVNGTIGKVAPRARGDTHDYEDCAVFEMDGFIDLNCFFGDKADLSRFKAGQKAVIVGKVYCPKWEPILINCRIVKLEPGSRPSRPGR